MKKDEVQIDEQHEFTGVTAKVVSVSGIKSQTDGREVFVRVKCHQKCGETKRKLNDRQTILFDQDFFYNTTEELDDDIIFELYQHIQGHGGSKVLLSSSKANRSKLNDGQGKLLGATKPIQVSRLTRKLQEKTYDMISQTNKVVARINVRYDYLERQDIVGGIKCPNLSLRPDKKIRSALTLENKYAAYKNLYSFLDGNDTPHCELFPKKFHH